MSANDAHADKKKAQVRKEKVKYFEFTSTSESEAQKRALRYFKLMDSKLLRSEIVKKGRKKFFFFGAQEVTYKFSVTPIYKRMLLPFLIRLFKQMGLKVFVRVSYKEPQVRINISGEDIGLFKRNKFELTKAVEQLVNVQLRQKIFLHPNTKIVIRLDTEDRFKKNTEEQLVKIVETAKEKIISTGESVTLDALNPADRRIVHQAINDDSRFQSNSVGDGRFKKIEITLS